MREFSAPWRAALAYTLLAAVLAITVGLPIVSIWRGTGLRAETLSPFELFAGQTLLASFLAAWFMLQERDAAREFFRVPGGNWGRRIARGVGVGARGWLITLATMAALGLLARGTTTITPREGFTDTVVWLASRPLWLRAALIVSAMTIEEAFFRAFLQRRYGILAATICFALAHVNYGSPLMSAGVFVIGWILGVAFREHDDLVVCAAAHGVFDAIQLLVILPLVASQL